MMRPLYGKLIGHFGRNGKAFSPHFIKVMARPSCKYVLFYSDKQQDLKRV